MIHYETFNNDAEGASDGDYLAFVLWLSERTIFELKQVKGNIPAQRLALCHYFRRGETANLTTSELMDFLCVSSPCILEEADYNEAECDAIMQISDTLTDEEISNAVLS